MISGERDSLSETFQPGNSNMLAHLSWTPEILLEQKVPISDDVDAFDMRSLHIYWEVVNLRLRVVGRINTSEHALSEY